MAIFSHDRIFVSLFSLRLYVNRSVQTIASLRLVWLIIFKANLVKVVYSSPRLYAIKLNQPIAYNREGQHFYLMTWLFLFRVEIEPRVYRSTRKVNGICREWARQSNDQWDSHYPRFGDLKAIKFARKMKIIYCWKYKFLYRSVYLENCRMRILCYSHHV